MIRWCQGGNAGCVFVSEMAQVELRSGRVEAPASAIEPAPMNPRRMGSGPPTLPIKTSVAASPLMASITSNAASASASPAADAASAAASPTADAASARSGALAFLGRIGRHVAWEVPTLAVPTRELATRGCRGARTAVAALCAISVVVCRRPRVRVLRWLSWGNLSACAICSHPADERGEAVGAARRNLNRHVAKIEPPPLGFAG